MYKLIELKLFPFTSKFTNPNMILTNTLTSFTLHTCWFCAWKLKIFPVTPNREIKVGGWRCWWWWFVRLGECDKRVRGGHVTDWGLNWGSNQLSNADFVFAVDGFPVYGAATCSPRLLPAAEGEKVAGAPHTRRGARGGGRGRRQWWLCRWLPSRKHNSGRFR